ncbi:peroxidase-related enzyme [Leptobacterium sp. I13]|uniref:carboxymuconolactone decarboxylase family protein n=1 Tax=Leptobacterium meishanense TaxID=3128904 RepID=UPI0030EEC3E4
MSWIKTIPYGEASGKLKNIYNKIKGPDNHIDNILTIHSLRPHTLTGHMSLYKNVLHHSGNTLPNWFLEALGSYVSYLNRCNYCYAHHTEGMKRFLGDEQKTTTIKNAIENNTLNIVFTPKELVALNYARKLTRSLSKIEKNDFIKMKSAGYQDGEILEINQVVSYFNYANRTVLGLGVSLDGEILGLSPKNKDSDHWQHE